MKKYITGLMVASSMFCLAACGSTGEKIADKPEEQKIVDLSKKIEPTELTFWHAMKGGNGEAIEQIVSDYNETVGKEKGIKVTAVFQDTKIASKVKLASGSDDVENAPDIIQTVGSDIPTISRLPQIVPAQEFLSQKEAGISTEDFYPNLVRAFTFKDKVIGVPMNASTLLLYYNQELLEKVGVTEAPKTIADLADVSKKLVGHQVVGLTAEIARYQLANFIVSQSETSYMGDNEGGRKDVMTKLTIKEDGTLDKFLTEWQKLIDSNNYKHLETNINEEFSTGNTAMALMSSARLGTVKKLVGDKFTYKVAFLPKVAATDTSGASVGGSSLVLYNRKDANKLAAAWDFVKYATSAKAQSKWSQATGYLPVNVKTEEEADMKEFYAKNPNYKVALEQMKASSPMAQEPFDLVNWQINDIVKDAMAKFATKELTKDQVIDEIVTKSNEAIAEFNRVNQ